ncbi:hypothetical protein ACU686_23325 [Yinghuangia aomiensis]
MWRAAGVHQHAGNVKETYGGVAVTIDRNALAGRWQCSTAGPKRFGSGGQGVAPPWRPAIARGSAGTAAVRPGRSCRASGHLDEDS